MPYLGLSSICWITFCWYLLRRKKKLGSDLGGSRNPSKRPSSFLPWAAMHLLEWDARAGVLCTQFWGDLNIDEDSSSFSFPSSHVKSLIGQWPSHWLVVWSVLVIPLLCLLLSNESFLSHHVPTQRRVEPTERFVYVLDTHQTAHNNDCRPKHHYTKAGHGPPKKSQKAIISAVCFVAHQPS